MTDGEARYARLAAQMLRTLPVRAESLGAEDCRDKMVAAMALAIAEKRRRRRTLVAAGVVLAAAAAVLLMVRATSGRSPNGQFAEATLLVEENIGVGNTLVRNSARQPLLGGVRVLVGDLVEGLKDSRTTLGFANGTRVGLSEAGSLRVDGLAATRRFSLAAGHLHARVAKLALGERFIVDTPDAEVEVRGTVFEVSVVATQACPTLTKRSVVEVREGAVWVRSGKDQVVLGPGESWSSPCIAAPAAGPELPSASKDPSAAARPLTRAARHTGGRSLSRQSPMPEPVVQPPEPPMPQQTLPAQRESRLAEQNELFSAAMASERRGDHAAAIRKMDQLIQQFPDSPLLESARAERQRIRSAQSQ